MGAKIEEYIDNAGNIVRDDDIVVLGGREYCVAYISHHYVNLDGEQGWLHLPFSAGVPERKVANAPKPTPPSPVRTVTRQEIVPGVYGRVDVLREESGTIVIGLTSNAEGKASMWTGLTSDELTAAIQVLTAIRDSMKENEK